MHGTTGTQHHTCARGLCLLPPPMVHSVPRCPPWLPADMETPPAASAYTLPLSLPLCTGAPQAFEHFINLNPRSPEFISLFIDDRLRKGLRGMADSDVDGVLDKVMSLFRCVCVAQLVWWVYVGKAVKGTSLGLMEGCVAAGVMCGVSGQPVLFMIIVRGSFFAAVALSVSTGNGLCQVGSVMHCQGMQGDLHAECCSSHASTRTSSPCISTTARITPTLPAHTLQHTHTLTHTH